MTKTGNKRTSHKAGLPPGTLVHIGVQKSEHVRIRVIDYNAKDFNEVECNKAEECIPYKERGNTSWINIDGLHDTAIINDLGKNFGLHPLLVEDVLNTNHRPKLEEFDNCLFLVLKMLGVSKDGKKIVSEQVSFVLGDSWVLSFQEQEGDIFDVLRDRMRKGVAKDRQRNSDYLLYRLIDTVVDNYFFVIEHITEQNEKLEEKVLSDPDESVLRMIQNRKRQLRDLRRSIGPLREAIGALQKDNNDLISEDTNRYLRDVYEHTIQVHDSIEMQRDMVGSIMDLYLSGISNKMNQVMKVLTIIATIFIPITFVAGIYGMNFDIMPELHWEYGYFGALGIMLAIIIVMLFYFKRKKWL